MIRILTLRKRAYDLFAALRLVPAPARTNYEFRTWRDWETHRADLHRSWARKRRGDRFIQELEEAMRPRR